MRVVRMRTGRAIAVCAVAFLVLVSVTGCSGEDLAGLLEAAADIHDRYLSDAVSMPETDPYYEYRHDFHHAYWDGSPWLDLGTAGFELDMVLDPEAYAEPDIQYDDRGRPVSAMAFLPCGAGPVDAMSGDAGAVTDPPGFRLDTYPGCAQDGRLYRRCSLLPDGVCLDGLFTGTSFLAFGGYGEASDQVLDYIRSHPDSHGVLWSARLFYDAGNLVPEGVLVRAYALDGSLEVCRYVHNVQPGIGIDHSDGRSWMEQAGDPEAELESESGSGLDE